MEQFIILLLSAIICVIASDEYALNGFVTANNQFASNLYSQLTKNEKGNFIISPLSAEVILSLTKSGCRDETAEEMKTVLHLPDNDEEINLGVKQSNFNNVKNYTLISANKMYIKKGYEIKEEFEKIAKDVYNTQIEDIDFSKNVEAAKTMNKWVENQTHNKIQNLIDPSIIDEATRLILINALYFKGNWSTQFSSTASKKEDFYKLDENLIKVDMMHHKRHKFNYYENNILNAKFLKLPFQGGEVSMVVVLPNEKNGISLLENQIDEVFNPQRMKRELVNVALPKFKIESTIKLKQVLIELGMAKVFDRDQADLSGIAGVKGELVVDDALQKGFIEIDEKGGEAAAATYVAISFLRSGFGNIQPEPKNFVVDHPFIFYIKVNNYIIFAGRVLEPNY